MSAVSAFILAGGKSTRMGSDKALVTLDGRTLLARALRTAHAVTSDVRIVGDPAKYSPFGPCIEDVFPDCGPLGGIHAALRSSRTDLNFVLAVDLPFVTSPLMEFLLERATESAAWVTVPSAAHGLQPLCAVYRRECAAHAEEALRAGRYKVDSLFSKTSTLVIEEEILRKAGFLPEMFRNLNTLDDLAGSK